LTVTWEETRDAKASQIELTGVSAAGVERETGLLAIVARPPLQISERTATDLNRGDPGDFMEWAARPDDATVLAYRYIRPGYTLVVAARRFDEAEVLQALVDSVRFTTVVADVSFSRWNCRQARPSGRPSLWASRSGPAGPMENCCCRWNNPAATTRQCR
jgi:hypothetical protein